MGAGAGLAEGRGPALLRGEARCRSRQHPGLLGPGPGWTVFPFLPRLGGGGSRVLGGKGGEKPRCVGPPWAYRASPAGAGTLEQFPGHTWGLVPSLSPLLPRERRVVSSAVGLPAPHRWRSPGPAVRDGLGLTGQPRGGQG